MKSSMVFAPILSAALVAGWAPAAQAALIDITDLVNTAEGLAHLAVDGHYTLQSAPSGVALTVAATSRHPNWVNPDLVSSVRDHWVTAAQYANKSVDPTCNTSPNCGPVSPDTAAAGAYLYSLDFVLDGDLSQTVIYGRWWTDDGGTMFLNGTGVSNLIDISAGFNASDSAAAFAVDGPELALLHPGLNTLYFQVQQTSGPSGLLVVFDTATTVTAAAEPGTLWLLGVSLAGVLLLTERRGGAEATGV